MFSRYIPPFALIEIKVYLELSLYNEKYYSWKHFFNQCVHLSILEIVWFCILSTPCAYCYFILEMKKLQSKNKCKAIAWKNSLGKIPLSLNYSPYTEYPFKVLKHWFATRSYINASNLLTGEKNLRNLLVNQSPSSFVPGIIQGKASRETTGTKFVPFSRIKIPFRIKSQFSNRIKKDLRASDEGGGVSDSNSPNPPSSYLKWSITCNTLHDGSPSSNLRWSLWHSSWWITDARHALKVILALLHLSGICDTQLRGQAS